MASAQYYARMRLVNIYRTEYDKYVEEEKKKRAPGEGKSNAYCRARTRLVFAHRSEYKLLYQNARANGLARNPNNKWPHEQDNHFKGGS